MRIAVIATSKIPSNTANSIQVMKVCQAYRQLDHQVVLYVPGKETCGWVEIKRLYGLTETFEIEWLNSARVFHRYDFALQAIRRAGKWGADLIHTWTMQAAFLLNWLGRPYLLELHELPSGKLGPKLTTSVLNSRNKKRFLPITHALKRLYEETFNYRFRPNEVVISPDGVDIERYAGLGTPAEVRTRLGLPEQFTAVYTGHLYAGRGMDLLVKLAQEIADIHFLWVGGRESDVENWRKIIKEMNLENITLTGFVANEMIPQYQAAGDVLLMPYETMVAGSGGGNTVDYCSPMKMFEYMAAGRPIVSSDLPVLHEVLNNENAIFCPSDDVHVWKDAIEIIRGNPEIAKSLSLQAKQDVQVYAWVERCRKGLVGFLNA